MRTLDATSNKIGWSIALLATIEGPDEAISKIVSLVDDEMVDKFHSMKSKHNVEVDAAMARNLIDEFKYLVVDVSLTVSKVTKISHTPCMTKSVMGSETYKLTKHLFEGSDYV